MYRTFHLIVCHGWAGVAPAPEVLTRRPAGARDAVPLAPFQALYRPASGSRHASRTTEELEQIGNVMLTLLAMTR